MLFRMFPPNNVAQQTITANGRQYSGTLGSAQDIPDMDAGILAANGWTKVCLVGPTSSRPNATMNGFLPNRIDHFYDTTIAKTIMWDGQNWRDIATANIV